MLMRQKALLGLLTQVGRSLSPTAFVKLVFLLRYETSLRENPSFYDFVPYDYGPFSFTLYADLNGLRRNGYVTREDESIALCTCMLELAKQLAQELPAGVRAAIADTAGQYGTMSTDDLIQYVYHSYPWFTINSKLLGRNATATRHDNRAYPAVYTIGYEGRSLESFLGGLLEHGIHVIADVRATPWSRKYGFSAPRLAEFCQRLGLEYQPMPSLGIPSSARSDLNGFASYQQLLSQYEQTLLPRRVTEVEALSQLMRRAPTVLVCVEKDVRLCHRSRLAEAIKSGTELEVVHI